MKFSTVIKFTALCAVDIFAHNGVIVRFGIFVRTEEYILPPEKENSIAALDLGGVPFEVVCDVVAYCEANKPTDTDWVVLPIANFDCYYGNTNFSKKWLSKIPTTILSREVSNGVSRVKLNI